MGGKPKRWLNLQTVDHLGWQGFHLGRTVHNPTVAENDLGSQRVMTASE
jgi:hypothetical protein